MSGTVITTHRGVRGETIHVTADKSRQTLPPGGVGARLPAGRDALPDVISDVLPDASPDSRLLGRPVVLRLPATSGVGDGETLTTVGRGLQLIQGRNGEGSGGHGSTSGVVAAEVV